jgi:hypothetical protein
MCKDVEGGGGGGFSNINQKENEKAIFTKQARFFKT